MKPSAETTMPAAPEVGARWPRQATGGRVLPVRTVLRLQQTVGNREVVRMLTMPALLPAAAQQPASWKARFASAWHRIARRKTAGDRS